MRCPSENDDSLSGSEVVKGIGWDLFHVALPEWFIDVRLELFPDSQIAPVGIRCRLRIYCRGSFEFYRAVFEFVSNLSGWRGRRGTCSRVRLVSDAAGGDEWLATELAGGGGDDARSPAAHDGHL